MLGLTFFRDGITIEHMNRTDNILQYVRQYKSENGIAPSLREIAAEFQTSTSVVHYHISKLVLDGRMKRLPGIARGIVLVEESEETTK